MSMIASAHGKMCVAHAKKWRHTEVVFVKYILTISGMNTLDRPIVGICSEESVAKMMVNDQNMTYFKH